MIVRHGDHELDDDPARVDREALWAFLSTSAYWGRWRTRAQVEAGLDAAWRVVAAYGPGQDMVGFSRAVSDGVSNAYLCDVYVLETARGQGLGTALVDTMIERGPGAELRWMLHTADAHPLYARFGFAPPGTNYLERTRPVTG